MYQTNFTEGRFYMLYVKEYLGYFLVGGLTQSLINKL